MQHDLIPANKRDDFSFPKEYLAQWKDFPVPMDDIGRVTFLRTYAAQGEEWFDVCKRVVEGAFSIYRFHMRSIGERPDAEFELKWARRMFESMMRLEWCPAGRGLQHMGHERMWKRGAALLNSCAFVSSTEHNEWVYFLADMSMLGVGVGFDTRGAGVPISRPLIEPGAVLLAEDTREGWALLFQHIYSCIVFGRELPEKIEFTAIRRKGAPLTTMGGVASGPGPLINAITNIINILDDSLEVTVDGDFLSLSRTELPEESRVLTAEQILDVGNNVGVCVVSGGIRRSAEICLFDEPSRETGFTAKQDRDKLMKYRWASNNSLILTQAEDRDFFRRVLESCSTFGDPGLLYLHNINGFKRPGEHYDREDRVLGTNPCGEQPLESFELCNLVETVPKRGQHRISAMCAFLYGKMVSLLPIHNERTNHLVRANRRIGVSLTGWVEAASGHTEEWAADLLKESYRSIQVLDQEVSRTLKVPTSIKSTSVKPSGTVSLVLGTSPGMNAHFAPYYIRRVNIENEHPLLPVLRAAGYNCVPNIYSPTSHVVEFPCQTDSPTGQNAIEQLETLKLLQKHWADNMVSNTIVYEDNEVDSIVDWLYNNQDWMRSVSFLRRQHSFEQAPLEEITQEKYETLVSALRPLRVDSGADMHSAESEDKWCDGGKCTLDFSPEAGEAEAPQDT
jgi:ribonucleoside-triphosphate reductase